MSCDQAEQARLAAELSSAREAAAASADTQRRLSEAVAAAEGQVDAMRSAAQRSATELQASQARVDELGAEVQSLHVQLESVRPPLFAMGCGWAPVTCCRLTAYVRVPLPAVPVGLPVAGIRRSG